MKYRFFLPILCITAIALAACGGSKSEPEPAAAPAAAPAPAPVIDTEAIEEIADQAAEEIGEALDAAAEALEQAIEMDGPVLTGTKWQAGDYTLTFKSVDEVVDGTVHGKVQGTGGEIPAFLPGGMEFSYTLEPDGTIEIVTPRGSFNGTYDGEELILENSPATLLEQ
mgnify:CR=1 FL=1